MQLSSTLFGMISLHWKQLPSPIQLLDQIQYKWTFIVLAKEAQSLARKYPCGYVLFIACTITYTLIALLTGLVNCCLLKTLPDPGTLIVLTIILWFKEVGKEEDLLLFPDMCVICI